MVSALRAQGPLTDEKKSLLMDIAAELHIPRERYSAEIRRAVNDEKLSTIAQQYVFLYHCEKLFFFL